MFSLEKAISKILQPSLKDLTAIALFLFLSWLEFWHCLFVCLFPSLPSFLPTPLPQLSAMYVLHIFTTQSPSPPPIHHLESTSLLSVWGSRTSGDGAVPTSCNIWRHSVCHNWKRGEMLAASTGGGIKTLTVPPDSPLQQRIL